MKPRVLACAALALVLVSAGHVDARSKAHKTSAPAKKQAPSKVARVVEKLQARYDATSDFTADFVQDVEVSTLHNTIKSTGKVYFKRPGRMRWEFEQPDKQTIVADGEMLWVYQPEHRQVLKAPFRAAFQSATPISFLFGVGRLDKDFDPSLVAGDGTNLRLKLVPKEDKDIGVLILDVTPDTYDIARAEVTDPLGNVTRLTFTNLKRSVGLETSRFQFTPPAGTDVVAAPGSP